MKYDAERKLTRLGARRAGFNKKKTNPRRCRPGPLVTRSPALKKNNGENLFLSARRRFLSPRTFIRISTFFRRVSKAFISLT